MLHLFCVEAIKAKRHAIDSYHFIYIFPFFCSKRVPKRVPREFDMETNSECGIRPAWMSNGGLDFLCMQQERAKEYNKSLLF